METNASHCRDKGWGPGDLLCCGDELPDDQSKYVRLTAVGDTEVRGRHVHSDCSEGPETVLTLLPHSWRRLSLREWQSLQDTHPASPQ